MQETIILAQKPWIQKMCQMLKLTVIIFLDLPQFTLNTTWINMKVI